MVRITNLEKHNEWLNKKKRKISFGMNSYGEIYYKVKNKKGDTLVIGLGVSSGPLEIIYVIHGTVIELVDNANRLLLPKKHKYKFSKKLTLKHLATDWQIFKSK